MKTILLCLATLLLGSIGTWLLLRPEFSDKEQLFYREVVTLRAKVQATGIYEGSGNAMHKSMQWQAVCREMKPSPFRDFALTVAFSVGEAGTPQGAKEFLSQADSFTATYAARMP